MEYSLLFYYYHFFFFYNERPHKTKFKLGKSNPLHRVCSIYKYSNPKMEKKQTEIEETVTKSDGSKHPNPNPSPKTVRTEVPQVEIHLYRRGKGPIDVFKLDLGGWEQDQLDIRNILDKYGFKSVFAFSPGSGRGVPIRFHPRNGRSLLPYKNGSLIYIDGEPKVKLKTYSSLLISFCFFIFKLLSVWLQRKFWIQRKRSRNNSLWCCWIVVNQLNIYIYI